MAWKLIAAVLVIAVLGVPIVDTWRALLLVAGLFALCWSDVLSGPRARRRAVGAVLIVVGVVAVKALLPRADIPEGHNVFLVYTGPDVLEKGLPPEVYSSWERQFNALYPPGDPAPFGAFSRDASAPPSRLYAWSADAIWRPSRFSRQVDEVFFRNLAEFRGGFANETVHDGFGQVQHNFYVGRLRRETMPFFVVYELTAASVGSRLSWKGQVFWERAGGAFEEVIHPDVASRAISDADVGRRVFAGFFPVPGALSFDVPQYQHYVKLELSRSLRASAWAKDLLTLAGWFSIVVLMVRIRWREYLTACTIFAAAYVIMAVFGSISLGKFLGRGYTPLGGGDDGAVFEMYGRASAMFLSRGQVLEALKGGEAVYWWQPGFRYVRTLEKVMFGDTYQLYGVLVACLPLALFYLVRHLVGSMGAFLTVALFLVMPVGSFSYLQYIRIAKLGYGECAGALLFLLGLVWLLRAEPRWGGRDERLTRLAGAGLLLAAAVFIRPNFVLGVAWLAAALGWQSLRRRQIARFAALCAGLLFVLVMPLHNWYYGGEFILMSKTGASSVAMAFGVGDYVDAFRDVLTGRLNEASPFWLIVRQARTWMFDLGPVIHPALTPLAQALHGLKLAALGLCVWMTMALCVGRPVQRPGLNVIAATGVLLLAPMLFARYLLFRYTVLGWDLCLLVLIVQLSSLTRVPQTLGLRFLRARTGQTSEATR